MYSLSCLSDCHEIAQFVQETCYYHFISFDVSISGFNRPSMLKLDRSCDIGAGYILCHNFLFVTIYCLTLYDVMRDKNYSISKVYDSEFFVQSQSFPPHQLNYEQIKEPSPCILNFVLFLKYFILFLPLQ